MPRNDVIFLTRIIHATGEENALIRFRDPGNADALGEHAFGTSPAPSCCSLQRWRARYAVGPGRARPGRRVLEHDGRAWRNFMETFPLFAALVLLATAMGKHSPATEWGSELYFFGRVLYVPIYTSGIPVARTAAWSVAVAGIVLLLLGIWPGL